MIKSAVNEVFYSQPMGADNPTLTKPEVTGCAFHGGANLIGAVHCLCEHCPELSGRYHF